MCNAVCMHAAGCRTCSGSGISGMPLGDTSRSSHVTTSLQQMMDSRQQIMDSRQAR
jgi:hypothetical protein